MTHPFPLAVLVVFIAGIYVAVKYLRELRSSPPTANPWPDDIEAAVHQPDALPICHRCFTPQNHHGWFCPECGTATGPYNNLMPYLYIFSEGEVLRAGVLDPVRPHFLVIAGYILLALCQYVIFVPFFLFRFFRNLSRQSPAAADPNQDSGTPS